MKLDPVNTIFNTPVENEDLFGLKIYSNCNNEVYKIPEPPACKTCKKLICKPLKDINIDINEINNKSTRKPLGKGGMNIVYDASYYYVDKNGEKKEKNLAIRLTRVPDRKILGLEQIGLLYQTKLSKSEQDGGFDCPYIAKVFDFGMYKNMNNVRLPNVEGNGSILLPKEGVYGLLEKLPEDLLERILDGSKFEENDIKIMTKQILIALSCMHNHDIYHFDIKPENIMMCDKGNQNIKLIDFGLCYTYNEKNTSSDGHLTQMRGTPNAMYLSPGYEYRRNKKIKDRPYPIDDLWSVGIIMCLILSPDSDLLTNFFPRTWDVATFTRKNIKPDGTYTSTTGVTYSKQCIDFIEKIFNTVDSKKEPTETFTKLTADKLLQDPWFQEVKGGKRKSRNFRIKRNKKTRSKKLKRNK